MKNLLRSLAYRVWRLFFYQRPLPTDRVAFLVGWETAKEFADEQPNPYPEGTEKHNSWNWGYEEARRDSRDTW